MRIKNCCFNGCRNDSRALDKEYMEGIFFIPFPKPKSQLEKCKRWIKACGRPNFLTVERINGNHYVCSEHFVGGSGPTLEYPDPMIYDPVKYMIDPRETAPLISSQLSFDFVIPSTIIPFNQIKKEIECEEKNVGSVSVIAPVPTNEFTTLEDVYFKFWELQLKMRRQGEKSDWIVSMNVGAQKLFVYNTNSISALGSLKIVIVESFQWRMFVYGNEIKELNSTKFPTTLKSLNDLLELLTLIDSFQLCTGNNDSRFERFTQQELKNGYINQYTKAVHANSCQGLFNNRKKSNCCKNCYEYRLTLMKKIKRAVDSKTTGKGNRNMSRNQLYKVLQRNRIEKRLMRKQILQLRKKVNELLVKNKISMNIPIFTKITENNPFCDKENFRKIILRELMNIVKNKKKRPQKWHSSILKWCSYINGISSTAYEAFREVLPLPAPRTLLKYTSTPSSDSGFTKGSLSEMRDNVNSDEIEGIQTNFPLFVDEMQINEEIQWDLSTSMICVNI